MKPQSYTANEKIAGRIIRHGVLLEGFKNEEVYRIIGFLHREIEPDLVRRLQKAAGKPLTRKRIEALQAGVRDVIAAGYDQVRANLAADLVAQAKVEASAVVKILADCMPFEVSLVTPNAQVIRQMLATAPINGEFVPDWFKALKLTTAQKINRQIMIGATTGEGIDKIIRRIVGTRANQYRDGILERARHEVASVVRTAVAGVSDNVRTEVYKANSDLIKAVQWTATLDTRTCIACMNLDGQSYDVEKCPRAPLHWNCRCSTVPVIKSWQELGLPLQEAGGGARASNAVTAAEAKRLRTLPPEERRQIKAQLQGQVPASLTYPQWLRRQSVEVQNEALGKTRAQLFRAGTLDVGEFVADNQRTLTLAELERALQKKM